MMDSEKLDLILAEMRDMKSEMKDMKSEITDMKSDMQDMKSKIQDMDQHITKVQLHIENGTDKNIQLIAENYIELTKKLNQAIPVADKNLAYEVKVNYLIEEVAKLKEEVSDLKSKIA